MTYAVTLNTPYRCRYPHVIKVVLDCNGILFAVTAEAVITGHILFNVIAHAPFIQITDIHKAVGDGSVDLPEILGNGGACRQNATGAQNDDKAAHKGKDRPIAVPGGMQTYRHYVWKSQPGYSQG